MPKLVEPSGPHGAPIAIVGEAPGADEEAEGRPFVGRAGWKLNSLLKAAGLSRDACFVTNALKYRPPGNNLEHYATRKKGLGIKNGWTASEGGWWLSPIARAHLLALQNDLRDCDPNCVIACGNYALWALTGLNGITKWQGSELDSSFSRLDGSPFRVVPLLHPAAILRSEFISADNYMTIHHLKTRVAGKLSERRATGPDYKFTAKPSFSEVLTYLHTLQDRLSKGPVKIAVDLETRSRRFIACIGLATNATEALCIPFMTVKAPHNYWDLSEELEIVWGLREVLTHENALVIGQNFNYDRQYIAKLWGFIPKLWRDTMIVHHTCFPGLEKGLDVLSALYTSFHRYWKDESKDWDPRLGEEQLWYYNCMDCVRTYEAQSVLEGVYPKMSLKDQVMEQMQLQGPALSMMLRGVRQDISRKAGLAEELDRAYQERTRWFKDVLGHELNPRANAPTGQMRKLFYEDLGIEPVLHRKTKQPTLDDAALDSIAKREPLVQPLIRRIRECRSISVFKSTFVEAELDEDQRLRCSVNTAGTETFRFSTSKDAFGRGCNLQNIPKGDTSLIAFAARDYPGITAHEISRMVGVPFEEFEAQLDKACEDGFVHLEGSGPTAKVFYDLALPNIRQLFLPDPEYVFSDWDLDRADLQVVVWEAEDDVLKAMLREGVDIHAENAKLLHLTRQQAKQWVHLTNYGGKARTAATATGLTVAESETARRRWFEAHPGILRWHERTQRNLEARIPFVTNKFGYTRHYFYRSDHLLPEALAWTPQSTVALVINKGLLNIYENLEPVVQVLLQVHDSLGMQCHRDVWPIFRELVRNNMTIGIPYDDPLVIPPGCRESEVSWGDC